MSSPGRVIKRITGFIVRVGLFSLIVFALLVSVLRLSFGQLSSARELIESNLSTQLDVELSIGGLTGDWDGLDPILHVTDMKLGMSGSSPVSALVLSDAELRLNVASSLVQQKMVFSRISAQQWSIELQLEPSDNDATQIDLKQIVSYFSSVESIDITGGIIQLSVDGHVYRLLDAAILRKETLFRQKLQTSFRLTQNDPDIDGLDKKNISEEYEEFRFIFNLEKNEDVTGRIYIEVPETQLVFSDIPWLKDYSDSIPVKAATVAGKFWLDIESSQITKLNSQISFPEIEIQTHHASQILVTDTALNLHWSEYLESRSDPLAEVLPNTTANRIGVSDLRFTINDLSWELQPWAIKIEQQGEQYVVKADAELLEVEPIAKLVQTVMGAEHAISNVLKNIDPKGVLRTPRIEVRIGEEGEIHYSALITLDDMALAPWRGGPGVEQLDGYMALQDGTFLVSLDAQPFGLYFPKLFDNKWSYKSAQGEIIWSIEEWGVLVRSGLLRLDGEHVSASGKIQIQIPYGKQEPELSVLVGLYKGTLDVRAEYLSNHPQVGSLMDWLDNNLTSGSIEEGAVLYQGSIQKRATKDSQNLQLVFDVLDLDMTYHPDWPSLHEISGTVWVNDDELLIEASSAKTDGIDLDNVLITGEAVDGSYLLEIQGEVQEEGVKAIGYLKKTPIFDLSPDLLGQLEVSGKVSVGLNLAIPIKKNSVNIDYEVDLKTYHNDIRLPDYGVEFKQVDGNVIFSSKTGITSRQLLANFLGEPVKGLIDTTGPTGNPSLTSIQISGLLNLDAIDHWYDLSQWPLLEGETRYKAFLDLYYDKRSPPLLQVSSDLVGVSSRYPAPLNKTVEQKRPFRFSMLLDKLPLHLDFSLDDNINFNMQISNGEAPRGSLLLGQGVANQLRFEPIELPGFSVEGKLEKFDLEPWLNWIVDSRVEMKPTAMTDSKPMNYGKDNFPVNRLNLDVADLRYGDLEFKASSLNLSVDELGVRLEHQSHLVSGETYWYFDPDRPITINLSELYINTEDRPENNQEMLKNIDPRTLPAIDFYAKNVFWNSNDTGSWKWVLRSDADGAHLSQGSIKSPDLNLDDTRINWLIGDAGSTTDLQLNGRVIDISNVMTSWGMKPTLSSESGSFKVNLKLNGRPDQLSTSRTNGEIDIEARNGSFTSGDGGSALGFTNIFNFHGLLRRLSSNFVELDGQTTFYKSITGGLIHRGDLLLIKDVIKVKGVTANFELSGLYHIDTDQLDMNMVVTLPLSKNLPWYAGFIGGLTTGVAVFVVSKLFESSINLFSSASYRVIGSIEDPKLELDEIFETEPNEKAMKLYEEYREEIQSGNRSDEQRSSAQ
ncbi:MAG: hypothetical protein KUG72_02345 [Pseudomonadales bacterium]|nr:hypothetical protein [Pseudomonadales bacterium]